MTVSTIASEKRLAQVVGPGEEPEPLRFPYPFPDFKPWICCICDHTGAPSSPYFCCLHWPSGEADNPWEGPFNDYYTKGEARLLWEVFNQLRKGVDRPIPPFPLDRAPITIAPGTRLFDRVKGTVPVEELAGRFTQLQPAGPGKLKGTCPLH